ncbi:MAG TPA: hypothetical protein VJO52_08365 [Gemmatimonadaceae bacterium]|nr:hypothetical protein [Gemmatimonadaceae bacterium]
MSMTRCCSALAALLLMIPAGVYAQQESYPQTLYWGSGLIDIPVAWVSPLSGDFSLAMSGKTVKGSELSSGLGVGKGINSNFAVYTSILQHAEIGLSVYSDAPEWGFFGRGLLLNEENFRGRSGVVGWIPSVAVGLENVGPYSHIDRFGLGYFLAPPTNANPNRNHVADSLHQNFSTAETVYGVATKSFSLSEVDKNWPNVGLSLSLGYGNGLFKDDGKLGAAYSHHATGGVFGGIKMDVYPSSHSVLSFMLENNAWDYNLGAVLNWRGLQAGVYWTEIGAGGVSDTAHTPYNYDKVAFSLGWQSNVFGLLRGHVLQDRVAQLQAEQKALVAEIDARQKRVQSLELEIDRYHAQNLLDVEQRRAQAEQELNAERDALKRLEERLRKLEQNTPPPQDKP